MKITLIVATSIDGITLQKGGAQEAHHEWTSIEDFNFFNSVRDNASLIFMGSRTYEGAKHQMKHSEGKLRIVFTRNPEKYRNEKIEGKLEFTSESPRNVIESLGKKYSEALLVGGASISTEFFKEKLVSYIYQTIEPVILGKGKQIVDEEMKMNIELLETRKLNEKGTLLLKYKVI